jgi:hypothetical protein
MSRSILPWLIGSGQNGGYACPSPPSADVALAKRHLTRSAWPKACLLSRRIGGEWLTGSSRDELIQINLGRKTVGGYVVPPAGKGEQLVDQATVPRGGPQMMVRIDQLQATVCAKLEVLHDSPLAQRI